MSSKVKSACPAVDEVTSAVTEIAAASSADGGDGEGGGGDGGVDGDGKRQYPQLIWQFFFQGSVLHLWYFCVIVTTPFTPSSHKSGFLSTHDSFSGQ